MKNHLLLVCLFLSISSNVFAITIYHSIGQHGEAYYSQFPPQGKFEILNFYQPKASTKDSQENIKQQQCQILHNNLNALNQGVGVQEIDKNGTSRQLSLDEIKARTKETKNAITTHCQNN